jgi:hypothetical protein
MAGSGDCPYLPLLKLNDLPAAGADGVPRPLTDGGSCVYLKLEHISLNFPKTSSLCAMAPFCVDGNSTNVTVFDKCSSSAIIKLVDLAPGLNVMAPVTDSQPWERLPVIGVSPPPVQRGKADTPSTPKQAAS